MPEILHRFSVAAPVARVHDLIGSTDGVAAWWTGGSVAGSTEPGGEFALYFGDAGAPAAVMRTVTDTPTEIAWHVLRGPDEWIGTRITFTLRPRGDGSTTLLFAHTGWGEPSEFMSGCSTNWGAYLTSLKSGAEHGTFRPFPQGELSRWD